MRHYFKNVTLTRSALKYLHDLAKEVLCGNTDEPGSEPAADEDGGRARPGAGRKSLKGRQGQVQGKCTDFSLYVRSTLVIETLNWP